MKTVSGNAKIVRNINRSFILNIIRTHQPISRVKIAKITGLNKSTVSSIVTDLLQEEIISEQIKVDQNVGRNPYDLSLTPGKNFIGAINIDSSMSRFAIFDINGAMVIESEISTSPNKTKDFIKCCIEQIKILQEKCNINILRGLGVSIAGIVDSSRLIVKFAPNLGWENFNIGEVLREKFPEVNILAVGNDAKASALAELWFGNHETPLKNFVFLSIGAGIGAGIVVDNKILDGETHASGEFGHIVLFEGGELCACGNYGCWETYASDKATVNRYVKRKHSFLNQPVDLVIDDIIDLAIRNDEIAKEVLTQTGYYLGLGIANIIKSVDPHIIVIGGKIVRAWNIIYPEILNSLKKRIFFSSKSKATLILPSSLKIRPRLLGAATLAIKEIFNDYKIVA